LPVPALRAQPVPEPGVEQLEAAPDVQEQPSPQEPGAEPPVGPEQPSPREPAVREPDVEQLEAEPDVQVPRAVSAVAPLAVQEPPFPPEPADLVPGAKPLAELVQDAEQPVPQPVPERDAQPQAFPAQPEPQASPALLRLDASWQPGRVAVLPAGPSSAVAQPA